MKKIIHALVLMLPFLVKAQTTVTYTQQSTYNGNQFTDGTAGSFNNGGTEMGQYANTSGNKQVVSFRKFKTDGVGGGSNRSLQVGDKFTITVAAKRAYGKIGVALLASPTGYTSWNDRENNYAVSVNLDGPAYTGSGYGNWYIRYNAGATSATSYAGDQNTYYDYKMEFTLTAPDRMTIAITTSNGNLTTTFNDVQLNTSNPITDYAMFLQDDWSGAANSNIYWKQTTTQTNTGAVSLGSSNNSFTVSGAITNGLDANSTSTNSLSNTLTKTGTGTVTLNGTNTYTGLTTVSNGTLRLNKTGGTTITSGNAATINSGGTLQISSNQSLGNVTLNSGGTLTIDAGVTLTVTGTFTGGGTLNNLGTIALNGTSSQTFPGSSTTVNNGTANTLTSISVNNSNGVTLNKSFTVAGNLGFTSGKVALNGNTLTLNGTVSGMSATNSFTGSNTSSLAVTSTTNVGTIYFDQSTSADVSTTNGTNALQNLVVSGSGGSVTLGNKLNLFNRFSVSAGTFNTGGALVLRSTSSNTAYVDQVGGTISGQVTVERYIHKQFRGWRMATAPVTFNNIISGDNNKVFNNWQSNFGYSNNYGTRITANVTPNSSTNGIDDATSSSNLLTYNSSTASWNKVVNTKTETMSGSSGSADNKGFFIFIRGDRTVTPTTNGTPNSFVTTTLASKGLLQTGSQTFTYTGASGNSWLIGNPYACPVDMSAITYNNIGNFVYFWDPNLTGASTNSPGTYTYFDRSNWAAGPVSGLTTKYFQSGQGFLVKPTSTSASIVFAESNKTTSANNNTYIDGTINGSVDLFNIKLFTVQSNGDLTNVDGLRAKFGSYADDVDDDDCIKIDASIESIGLSRKGKSLAIEARPSIVTTDTLFLVMNNMVAGTNYEFFINPINFDASVSGCKLIDNFLNTETPISLTSNTNIQFSVTSVAGSNAANRFSVVFTGAGALPINKLSLSAVKQNSTVAVNWVADGETAVATYQVEKANAGNSFATIGELAAKNGGLRNSYTLVDKTPSATNYYRIKAINNNGTVQYSAVVKVDMNSKNNSGISIYPNPVTGNSINLQLNNLAAGKATLNLYNTAGQLVYNEFIANTGGNFGINVYVTKTLAAGTYHLQVLDANGNTYNETIIKK